MQERERVARAQAIGHAALADVDVEALALIFPDNAKASGKVESSAA